jgi:hypothetical protein
MIKVRGNLVGYGLILSILASLEFFDASQSTKIWFIAIAGVALFNLEEEKKEEKRIEIVMKQNERLDALELQQYKLRDANLRIAKLENDVVSLEDDMIDVMGCESLKDDLFNALLKRDKAGYKDSSKSDEENQ